MHHSVNMKRPELILCCYFALAISYFINFSQQIPLPGLGAGRLPEPLIETAEKKPENRVLQEKPSNTTKDPVQEAKKAHSLETQKRKAKKEEFLQSLNDTQLNKIDKLHADHNQEGKQGPIIPEHHAEIRLEDMKAAVGMMDKVAEPDSEKAHHHLKKGQSGPNMPEHDISFIEPRRNRVQQVHEQMKGAGPRFPEHDIREARNETAEEKSSQTNETKSRPTPSPEAMEKIAKAMQLVQQLKRDRNNDQVSSLDDLLADKIHDTDTRDFLRNLMKQHIFPEYRQRIKEKQGKTEKKEESAKEDKLFKGIELEAQEFLALLNVIVREERINMPDDYFAKIQEKVMDNAQKSVNLAAYSEAPNGEYQMKKSLKAWLEDFIRFHNPNIIHDEN